MVHDSPENIFVKDGMLHIVARLEKEKKPNPNYREGSENWKENRRFIEITSAGIVSDGRAEFKYGRIVMRARMPKGAGLWPAFWTIGADRRNGGTGRTTERSTSSNMWAEIRTKKAGCRELCTGRVPKESIARKTGNTPTGRS